MPSRITSCPLQPLPCANSSKALVVCLGRVLVLDVVLQRGPLDGTLKVGATDLADDGLGRSVLFESVSLDSDHPPMIWTYALQLRLGGATCVFCVALALLCCLVCGYVSLRPDGWQYA